MQPPSSVSQVTPGDRSQQPNILFIVLDTQRADRVSCYQQQPDPTRPPTTPNLDRLAAEGTVFDRAISPAQWTIPAHASMFTGEYPSTHQAIQADLELGGEFVTVAELLQLSGYSTVAFCNNPLVGVLKNGLRRGFDAFYNYGGALPTLPAAGTPLPQPLAWMIEQYTQFWRRISYPVQNAFAKSDLLFQLALQPWLVPLWTRMGNFKGNTAASCRDLSRYLEERAQAQSSPQVDQPQPFFCFVNLMEPHLPYWPPQPFLDAHVPYFRQDRAARDFLRRYNSQSFRWMAPLEQPLSPLEAQVLSDIYDAEVAYQDHQLGQVFDTLARTGLQENTLVVVVADHGEGLGEHDYVGHAFVVFEELVRVPLILRYPERFPAGKRVQTPVSTRRLFHTVLEIAGFVPAATRSVRRTRISRQVRREIARLSLTQTVQGRDPEQATVLTEAFPSHILNRAIEKWSEDLLERHGCRLTRRAIYRGERKLVEHGSVWSLYNLSQDPEELQDLSQTDDQVSELQRCLREWVQRAEAKRPQFSTGPRQVDLSQDQDLVRRMQELGYLE